ncbi:hypothetical protein J2TS6_24620 [Paenibacillus albilobatus]|uniref:Uncharacterized protein n=1 Tax=Paenibacillus albilobatus TaxID=2716884 RepID=A0A919XFQ7_9BACL|nr:hypothetical protein J2TS6_24620 [Paenibacillus albilobatus]
MELTGIDKEDTKKLPTLCRQSGASELGDLFTCFDAMNRADEKSSLLEPLLTLTAPILVSFNLAICSTVK